jgi:predicted double-glycine peptidase
MVRFTPADAASLQAVLSYWGEDLREGDLMERLHTTEESGTSPLEIVRVAGELGLNATMELGLTIDDLASSVRNGVPVIIVAQAWTENNSASFSWAEDWEDGHYMVVIGVDASFVYLEDPAMLGSRGTIPIGEFNARWHDFLGTAPSAPGTILLEHMGIFIKGGGHAQAPDLVEVK